MTGTLVFDRVELVEADGNKRIVDRNGFVSIPIGQRVQYILGGKVQFFAGEQIVPTPEALNQLNKTN